MACGMGEAGEQGLQTTGLRDKEGGWSSDTGPEAEPQQGGRQHSFLAGDIQGKD